MGKMFAAVGTPDPRLNSTEILEFRMGIQLVAYARQDTPPSRLHPIPITILHCLNTTAQGGTPRQQAITELTWITFFFFLRLGD